MRTEDAVTEADGVWVTFGVVVVLYTVLGRRDWCVILRAMARRWREADERRRRGALRPAAAPPRRRRRRREQRRRRRRRAVDRRDALRRLRRRRLRRRASGTCVAGGGERGRARARADRLGDRPGLGGQPRLADLRARRALDRLLRRRSRRSSRRCSSRSASPRSGIVLRGAGLRLPRHRAGGSAAGGSPSALFALSSLLTPFFMGTVVGAIASAACRSATPRATRSRAGSTRSRSLIGALFVATGAYLAAVFLVSDARRAGDADLERYFTARALAAAIVAGRARGRRHRRPARRRALRLRRPHRRRRCRS